MKPSSMISRREMIRASAGLTGMVALAPLARGLAIRRRTREFNVLDFGAAGNGTTLDSVAIQRAVDEASAAGAGSRVLIPGGRRFLIGTINLKAGIDFHLADDAELLVSTNPDDYVGRTALAATNAQGLKISGTGTINGRSREFMDHYDEVDEWWRPKPFRPRLVVLTACHDLEVRDITMSQAPQWTLHLMGCERVLVDAVKIRNQLDVPNCDGIDPDHCRDVEIKNCDIACGDDAIVIKATRGGMEHGPSSRIRVSDCVLETQDSGVKIGTETTQDITDVVFERCEIKTSCRGCTIQLRDEGNVSNVVFRDINFVARYYSDPWWGRGEAISFTAIPRTPETQPGTISNVRVSNVTGRAENSVRISGSERSRIREVRFDNVDITLDRWTKYRGGVWDNRPTTAMADIEEAGTPGYSIRHADNVTLQDCSLEWGANPPDYFSHKLLAEDVTNLDHSGLRGTAAHPNRDQAVVIRNA